jgi:oligoendopeptidase F
MVTRSNTYPQKAWSLGDLFTDREQAEQAFGRIEDQVEAFESHLPALSSDTTTADFLDLVSRFEDITAEMNRLFAYAGLWFAADTQDQAGQTLVAKADQFMAQTDNRLLPFELWWKDLDDANAIRLMDVAGDYRHWLKVMRLFKPYTLTGPEEKIINIKDTTGANALQIMYDLITNRYTFTIAVDGDDKSLTRDELMTYVYHPDGDLRARAYRELYRVYGEDGPILGQMYQTLVRDWHNERVDLRGFATPLAARNLSNEIPNEVVDTLLDVCQENTDIFHRFFTMKAKILGIDRLRRYDIYAPVAPADKTYTFAQATDMVFDAFTRFDDQLTDLARRVCDEDHLDSEVRHGKRGGAFCWDVTPDLTPWVLTNYQSKARDVSTLAHELGHAVHSVLAADHTVFTCHASLPLAETASTFGEMLLLDHWLEREDDEAVRRDLLFSQMGDNYATIIRQAFFALFERQAHDMVQDGASVDDISQAYLDNLSVQFGDSVELMDEFGWEWVSIPHIYHTPFYVYAYTFGQLLVLALYQQYRLEGDSFKTRYLDILRAGGSDSPSGILSRAGIDIRQASFWQGGFDVLRTMLRRLEEMG